MATDFKDLPPGSQQSTSDLSEPPEFTDDEMREIAVKMSPMSRRESECALVDGQPEMNGEEAPPRKPSGNIESPADNDEIVAEIHVSPRATRNRVPSKRSQLPDSKPTASRQPAAKRPKTNTKKWEPNYVTQNSKSPLVGKDLRALLLHPQAWDVLGEEDKKEILALFPDDRHILNAGSPHARPNVLSLQNDDNFRHDTEEYVSNLSRDMHDPIWLQDAWAAHGSRAAGNFDQYYIRRLEADWKTTIPDDMKPEHLRSTYKPEASFVVTPPTEIAGAVDDHENADTIVAIGTNGSVNMEDGSNGDESIVVDSINVDTSKSYMEDDSPRNIVNGTDKDPAEKGNETDEAPNGDPDKMQTGP